MPPPKKPAGKPAPKASKPATAKGKGKGLPFADDAPAPAAPPAPPKPVSLDDVIGHESAKKTLRAAIAGGRIHHAWVFAGEAGVGKFTAALGFAAELLLPPSKNEGHAHLRDLLRSGNHPDVHVVTKELAKVSRVDTVRKQKQTTIAKAVLDEFLLEPAARTRAITTASPAGKVFIVDEAELIDPVGQNTMLKTLEEPPEGMVIILVTSVESRLLPTVRSRCQRVAFGTLTDAEVTKFISTRAVDLPPAQKQWAVWYARGSIGSALSAIDHGLYQWHAELSPMLDSAMKPGGRGPGGLGSAMAKLVDARAAAAVDKRPEASKDAANRLWAKRMLTFLAERFRNALNARGADVEATLRAIDLCRAGEQQVDANVAYGTVLENLAAQLMTPGEVLVGESG